MAALRSSSPLIASIPQFSARVDFASALRQKRQDNLTRTANLLDAAMDTIRALPRDVEASASMLTVPRFIAQKLPKILEEMGGEDRTLRDCANNGSALRLLARIVMKDPGKQSTHQSLAFKHLQDNLLLVSSGPVLPPTGGANAYRAPQKKTSKERISKSTDFLWSYTLGDYVLTAYAAHKYTEGAGGAQDNQFQDLMAFIEEFRLSPRLEGTHAARYYAIADGSYYQAQRTGSSGALTPCSRLETVRQTLGAACPVRILTIDDTVLQWALDVGQFADEVGVALPRADARIVKEASRLAAARGLGPLSPMRSRRSCVLR